MALLHTSGDLGVLELFEQSGRTVERATVLLRDGRAGRNGIDALEGLQLATALDDIVDHAEQTADMLGLYGVEATMEHACLLADVLVAAGEQVGAALGALRGNGEMWFHLVESSSRSRRAPMPASASPTCSRASG